MKTSGMAGNGVRQVGAVLLLLSGACVEDSAADDAGAEPGDASTPEQPGLDASPDGSDAAVDPGTSDAGFDGQTSPTPDGSTPEDAGSDSDDGGRDGATPPGCSVACQGATPVCVEGQCVQCSASDDSACTASQVCDAETHTCVDGNAPFELDCANLPSDGACQGGPREVLLAMHEMGRVAMFDPADGHFLGYYKSENIGDFEDPYWFATQGPDQCIWLVNEGDRGVERWTPEGVFMNTVIDPSEHYVEVPNEGQQPVVDSPYSIAFSEDKVFVASTSGYPEARLARFSLAGEFEEVVLDDGSIAYSFLVLRDGSLVLANDTTNRLELLPAGGGAVTPLVSVPWPGQVSYAGNGDVLALDKTLSGSAYRVTLSDQTSDTVELNGSDNKYGIAALDNGKWLVTGGTVGISTLDPEVANPNDRFVSVHDNPALDYPNNFSYIGRACLSEAFVASRAPQPAETTCPGGPASAATFSEDFETGDFTGTGAAREFNGFFDVDSGDHGAVSIDTTTSAGTGEKSLKIVGGTGFRTGVYHTFSSVKPTYISYYMKLERDDAYWVGYFAFKNSTSDGSLGGVLATNGSVTAFNSSIDKTIAVDEWVRVELRNIDWTARTYDVYVNCERAGEDVVFADDTGDDLDRIDFFNNQQGGTGAPFVAWFDELVFK
jgi:hypothetical protein